jgi:hypothetical protein
MPGKYQIDGFPTTQEQEDIMDAAGQGMTFKCSAFAGATKTHSLKGISQILFQYRILYLAFNKAISDEARATFPSNVVCRTAHSLAFSQVVTPSQDYQRKMNAGRGFLPFKVVQEFSGVPADWRPFGKSPFHVAMMINDAAEGYFNSADSSLNESHLSEIVFNFANKARDPSARDDFISRILKYAEKLVCNIIDPSSNCPLTHNAYLKIFQLRKPILPYDTVLLDEGQDTNPVLADIFESQSCQRIISGDKHQEIYAWRKAVNSMDKMDVPEYPLTHSFRFGEHIAGLTNRLLTIMGETRTLVGRSEDNPINFPIDYNRQLAYICRTNAMVFDCAIKAVERGSSFFVIGGIDESRRLLTSAYYLYKNIPFEVKAPELKMFDNWGEFTEITEELNKSDWKVIVEFVEKYRDETLNVIDSVSQKMTRSPDLAQTIISTAHRSKGLGFEQVRVTDDFEFPEKDDEQWKEKLNVIYVAMTRAKRTLCVPQDILNNISL